MPVVTGSPDGGSASRRRSVPGRPLPIDDPARWIPAGPVRAGNARVILARSIALPADAVFPVLADARLQSRWMLATEVSAVRDAPAALAPPAVGSRLVARTGIGRLAFVDTMRVTEYRPPRRWVVEHTGGLVRGWGEFGVLPAERGCRVYWAEEFVLPMGLLGRIGWAAGGWLIRSGIAVSLARLARGLADGTLIPADAVVPADTVVPTTDVTDDRR